MTGTGSGDPPTVGSTINRHLGSVSVDGDFPAVSSEQYDV